MTPTSTMLQLYRTQVAGVSPLTVSAHACSTFLLNPALLRFNTPTCSTTEIARSTLPVTPPSGWLEWDITSLAQSNIANGNQTMTIQLKMAGSGNGLHTFAHLVNMQRSPCVQHSESTTWITLRSCTPCSTCTPLSTRRCSFVRYDEQSVGVTR